MALPPYPLPRETRETAILAGSGVDTYGPFAFKIFDENDVEVWRLDEDETDWALQAVTVTKTAALAHDTFSITFPAVVPVTTTFVVVGRRLHERQVAVTRGGAIDSTMLEKELSKQGAILQEIRRDLGRSVRFPPGFDGQPFLPVMTAGKAIIVNPAADGLTIGPDAADIAAAQGYAQIALEAKDEAETAAATAVNATQFIHVAAGGTISGLGPYDMGYPIGSKFNLYLTIGNLPQDPDTYSIDGTTFTLLSVDGIDGLPWRGRIMGNVRALNAPADGSVERPALGTALTAEIDGLTSDIEALDVAFEGLEDLSSPDSHRMQIHGIKPDKLDTNRLYLYEGTVYNAAGTIFVHNTGAYVIDMTTVGVGGKDTATPIGPASPGGLYDYFPYVLRRDSDGAFGAVLSNSKFYGDVVVPAGYTMVRKLRFGFRYNGSWDGIPNHDATHWPWPSVRLTDAQASSVWRALNAGTATTNTAFSVANWIPDNARQVSVLVHVTTGGSAGTAYIKTPGVTGEIEIPGILNSTVALIIPKIRINSTLDLEYRCTSGQSVSVYVLEYFMTEPS